LWIIQHQAVMDVEENRDGEEGVEEPEIPIRSEK
jgi:hypothetical protein